MRGRYLRSFFRNTKNLETLKLIFAADNCWGVAALLWIATGLMRAFGGLEKGSDFYLHNPLFWVKMSLFGFVVLIEILPMMTLIRWRIAIKRGTQLSDLKKLPLLKVINDIELGFVVLILFVASAMARGIGM
jgi:putative membrane protein